MDRTLLYIMARAMVSLMSEEDPDRFRLMENLDEFEINGWVKLDDDLDLGERVGYEEGEPNVEAQERGIAPSV